jgi:hypothetical protein
MFLWRISNYANLDGRGGSTPLAGGTRKANGSFIWPKIRRAHWLRCLCIWNWIQRIFQSRIDYLKLGLQKACL